MTINLNYKTLLLSFLRKQKSLEIPDKATAFTGMTRKHVITDRLFRNSGY